jgi:hypothetical protein
LTFVLVGQFVTHVVRSDLQCSGNKRGLEETEREDIDLNLLILFVTDLVSEKKPINL